MFRNLETNCYLCTEEIKRKWQETTRKSHIKRKLFHSLRAYLSPQVTNCWKLCTVLSYRLFAFWDTQTDTLVIATHGIIKKTQKTPKKEIAKAERIRQEYFNARK